MLFFVIEVMNVELGKTFRELRVSRGWSQVELIEKLAEIGCVVSAKAPSKWEHGVTEPSVEQFLGLCAVYEIRDVLETFSGRQGELSGLNGEGRRRVREYIRLLRGDAAFSENREEQPAHFLRTIPLYDLPVSAGTGQFLDSSDYTLLEVDETVPLSATFAVRVRGDSMEPKYTDGQILYIKPQQTLERGEIGIFVVNGDAYCKQYGGTEKPELCSVNPAYAPILIDEFTSFKILGKVVG